jgi:hypothetical protein
MSQKRSVDSICVRVRSAASSWHRNTAPCCRSNLVYKHMCQYIYSSRKKTREIYAWSDEVEGVGVGISVCVCLFIARFFFPLGIRESILLTQIGMRVGGHEWPAFGESLDSMGVVRLCKCKMPDWDDLRDYLNTMSSLANRNKLIKER